MKLRLTHKKQEAATIWSFWFHPEEPAAWMAGQSLRLEIPAGYDTDERRFTIASAPFEQDIMITTRMSDSVFKQGLAELLPGTIVDGFAIEGDFMDLVEKGPALFVAAGIGITPYRSVLLQSYHEGRELSGGLLYVASASELLFLDELQKVQQGNPDFSVELLKDHRITVADILKRHTSAMRLYLSGPSTMVDQLGRELIGAGIAEVQIKRDRFTGFK